MNKIFDFLKRKPKVTYHKPIVKVYSHPRSGTHFLEAFLGRNFYSKLSLEVDEVVWGHWSDRRINKNGNPYGKLFGNHLFPEDNMDNFPKVYIYRDGRAVAYSFWKTENFSGRELENLSFDQFLKAKIDWHGTPSKKASSELTILEHWAQHVKEWLDYADNKENVCIVKYEDLVKNPYKQYLHIHQCHFQSFPLKNKDEIDIIKEPVGLLPNTAIIDAWKESFTEENMEIFQELIRKHHIDY